MTHVVFDVYNLSSLKAETSSKHGQGGDNTGDKEEHHSVKLAELQTITVQITLSYWPGEKEISKVKPHLPSKSCLARIITWQIITRLQSSEGNANFVI